MRQLDAFRALVRFMLLGPLAALALLGAAPPRQAYADTFVWTRWAVPYPRTGAMMGYDPVRQRLVLHGGYAPGPDLNSDDNWMLDLNATPPRWHWRGYGIVRTDEISFYDGAGDQLVVYGGQNDGFQFNDARAYSLSTLSWASLLTSGTPPTAGASLVSTYDSRRRRMLMVGFHGEIFSFDVASRTWKHIPGLTGTVPLDNTTWAAFDSRRDRLLINIAGQYWQTPLADPVTGQDWTPLTVAGTSPSGVRAGGGFEVARDRVDFLAGDGLWVIDFSVDPPTWAHVSNTPLPPALVSGFSSRYDSPSDRFVALAGNEVWQYSLGSDTWSLLLAGSPIPLRSRQTAVVAPPLDAMLVCGGNTEVWRFALDGSGFSLMPTAGPAPARTGHGAIFDPVRQRMLVFGGQGGGNQNDVLQLTLTGTPTWSPVATAGTPPSPRSGTTALYDPVRDRMLVVGADDPSTFVSKNDVWALDLSSEPPTWSQLLPDSTLPPNVGLTPVAVYDSRRDRVILVGSGGGTRAWSLPLAGPAAWSPLAGGASLLPERFHFAAVYDSTNDRVLTYGGEVDVPGPAVSTLNSFSLGAIEGWGTLAPPGLPAGIAPRAKSYTSFVRDAAHNRFVMFGGLEALNRPQFPWQSPGVWFLGDPNLTLDVPGPGHPGVGLALASCGLVGTDRVAVRYSVAEAGALSIDVVDIQGRRLGRSELTAAAAGAGDATVALARPAAPGLVIVYVRQGAHMAARKLVMIH